MKSRAPGESAVHQFCHSQNPAEGETVVVLLAKKHVAVGSRAEMERSPAPSHTISQPLNSAANTP